MVPAIADGNGHEASRPATSHRYILSINVEVFFFPNPVEELDTEIACYSIANHMVIRPATVVREQKRSVVGRQDASDSCLEGVDVNICNDRSSLVQVYRHRRTPFISRRDELPPPHLSWFSGNGNPACRSHAWLIALRASTIRTKIGSDCLAFGVQSRKEELLAEMVDCRLLSLLVGWTLPSIR